MALGRLHNQPPQNWLMGTRMEGPQWSRWGLLTWFSYCGLWKSDLLARDQCWAPGYGIIPWEDQSATWWQVNYVRLLSSWKDQWLVFTGLDAYSRHALPRLPIEQASASILIWGLIECPIHRHRISHSIGESFHSKEHMGVNPCPWNPLVVSQTTFPRRSRPQRILKLSSEGTAEESAQTQHSERRGHYPLGCSICVKSETSVWHCVPIWNNIRVGEPKSGSMSEPPTPSLPRIHWEVLSFLTLQLWDLQG